MRSGVCSADGAPTVHRISCMYFDSARMRKTSREIGIGSIPIYIFPYPLQPNLLTSIRLGLYNILNFEWGILLGTLLHFK